MGQIKIYELGNGKEIIQFKGNIFKDLKGFISFVRLKYGEENLTETLKHILS